MYPVTVLFSTHKTIDIGYLTILNKKILQNLPQLKQMFSFFSYVFPPSIVREHYIDSTLILIPTVLWYPIPSLYCSGALVLIPLTYLILEHFCCLCEALRNIHYSQIRI